MYLQIDTDLTGSIDQLSDPEAGRLFKAALHYMRDGEEICLPGQEKLLFSLVKIGVDRSKEKYEAKCAVNRENGMKGGRPKKTDYNRTDIEETQENRSVITETEKSQIKENKIKENTNKNKDIGMEKRFRFSPPTLEEVTAYCRERGNNVDPARFIDFYSSKGWKVGNQPMKDWKAAVRTWEQRDKIMTPFKKTVAAQQYEQRDYSNEDDSFEDEMIKLMQM